jgi:hypothetical protein
MPRKGATEPEEEDFSVNPLAAPSGGDSATRRDRDVFDEDGIDANGKGVVAGRVANLESMDSRDIILGQIESAGGLLNRDQLANMRGITQGEKIQLYDSLVRARDNELVVLKKALWVESKVGSEKKGRENARQTLEALAAERGIHQSPNTIGTIRSHEKTRGWLDDDDLVYAFVFSMPADTLSADKMPDIDEVFVSHECWVTVEKIMSCDLTLRCILPVDRKVCIIAVGADYETLVDEAHTTNILMRLQETKGAMEFHSDLIRYYSSNHGGLNEYDDGRWKKRDPSLIQLHNGIIQHWAPLEQLSEAHQKDQIARDQRIFSSSLKQRLVLSRLQRRARYNPAHMVRRAPPPCTSIAQVTKPSNTTRSCAFAGPATA